MHVLSRLSWAYIIILRHHCRYADVDRLEELFSVLNSLSSSDTYIRAILSSGIVLHSLKDAICCAPRSVVGRLWSRVVAIISRYNVADINHADFKWVTFIYTIVLQGLRVDESSAQNVRPCLYRLIEAYAIFKKYHYRLGISVIPFKSFWLIYLIPMRGQYTNQLQGWSGGVMPWSLTSGCWMSGLDV
jgi:hypothetical protein